MNDNVTKITDYKLRKELEKAQRLMKSCWEVERLQGQILYNQIVIGLPKLNVINVIKRNWKP